MLHGFPLLRRGALLRAIASSAATIALLVALPAVATASVGYSHIVLAHHPVSYWRLGEHSGTVARDSSGNGHNAIYHGAPRLGLPGAITGDPSTAVGFDGTDDDAVWRPTSSFRGAFSVVAWIDNTGSTGNGEQTFFDTRDPPPTTAAGEYSFDFKLSFGNLKVDVGNGRRWFLTGPGIPFTFQLNTWYQVAAVIHRSFVTLYVNGRSIGSEAYPLGTGTPLLYNRSHHVYLGTNARFTTERFLGHMDEVAIYQTPLTSDEINGLYHAGIAG
jgi:hypothetical protein